MLSRRSFLSTSLSTSLAASLAAPAISADPPGKRWASELKRIAAADAAKSPPKNAVVFAGSSTIRLWKLSRDFPALSLVNRGFGGSTIPDNTAFIPQLIAPLQPRAIVFYAGDNDLAAKGASAEKTADDFKSFVASLDAALPTKVPIVFLSIKPSIQRWALRPLQEDANHRIADFTKSAPDRFHFIDLSPTLLAKDGKPDASLFEKDGLHVNATAYARWAPLVSAALKALKVQ
jgi:lysophospholipase L1-like esterase